jgi:hypothetical protein
MKEIEHGVGPFSGLALFASSAAPSEELLYKSCFAVGDSTEQDVVENI